MKYCLPFTLLLLLHLTSIAQQNHRNNKNIETIKINNIQKDYKNLLILGSGNMASRKFIHDIVYELNKRLGEDDITYKYEYLGADDAQINENLKKAVLTNKHDAILIISPISSSINYYASRNILNGGRYVREGHQNDESATTYDERLLEKIDLQITEDLNSEPIWTALLQTNINHEAQKIFAAISRNLIAEMKKNMLIAPKKK
ncbi:hypothetical protein [Chitinophaga sp. RAB17]|uniref:hypothetical protein n=1 Tax=Chitinophaga sp. RAB17 TaxID=3233049 RepID=UPI003F9398BE